MALREHKIRCSNHVWDAINREANNHGVSASQYVLEAAYARAVFDWARRGGGGVEEYPELVECARKFAKAYTADSA